MTAEAPLSKTASTLTVVAYLYDLPAKSDVGTLLTHGVKSEWGSPAPTASSSMEISVEMRTVCCNIQEGHRLALGIDLDSVMYKAANSAKDLKVTVKFDGASELLLPIIRP